MEVGRKPNPGNMRAAPRDISSQSLHRASCSNGMVIYDALKNEEPIRYGDSADDDYLDSFPPGFRFCPLDEELVLYYLKKKVMNLPLPRNRIMEVNLYSYNPEKLAEKHKQYGEKEWYFFTPRDKKYRNGTRPNRAAGDGFWKATGADREVRFNDRIIGYRKALVFYQGKPPRGDKSNWIMHEYRVNDPPSPRKESAGYSDMRLDDWVLCRIYQKLKKSGRTQAKTDFEAPLIQIPEETNGEIMALDDNEMTDYNKYLNPVNETFLDQSLFQETWDSFRHIYDEQLSPFFPTTYLNEIVGEDNNLWIPTPVGLCVEPWVSVDFSTTDDDDDDDHKNKNNKNKNNNSNNNNNNNKKDDSDENYMDAKMDRRS